MIIEDIWQQHCLCMFRCTQLNSRVVKLTQELKEEQEMNRCLRANQVQLQACVAEEECKAKESGKSQRPFTSHSKYPQYLLTSHNNFPHCTRGGFPEKNGLAQGYGQFGSPPTAHLVFVKIKYWVDRKLESMT